VAERFYRFLARDVDIRATSQSEVAMVNHLQNGDVEVAVSLQRTEGARAVAPYFRRLFHPDETDEVRIYLAEGDDSLVAAGGPGEITVRVIGGDGDDFIDDSAGTRLRVCDASGANRVLRASGTKLDTRPYTAPVREKAPWIPPRDWGRRTTVLPWIGGNSDLGVLFLATLQSEGYGFRKDPYASKGTFRLGYATRAGAFGADYRGEFRRENSQTRTGLYLRASGLDFLHFYGFGNETGAGGDEDFYKVKHTEYVVEPSVHTSVTRHGTAAVRLSAKYTKTDLSDDRFIATAPPYGTEDYFQTGAGAGLSIDTRDSDTVPSRGFRISADGMVFPPVGAVESTFGEVHGEAAYHQPIPVASNPTLALRAGGKQVWGTYPWHEAAYIGGGATVRGFAQQRFAGDSSLYGSAELRVPLARIYLLVPGNLGVYAFGDVGRVFLDGESSSRWHAGAGGGFWLGLIYPGSAVSVSIASSEEGTRVYIHAGLAF
jgi:hypothetical protein